MPGFPPPTALRTEAMTTRPSRRALAAAARAGTGRPRAAERARTVVLPIIGVVAVLIGLLAFGVGITEELESNRPDRRWEAVVMIAIAAAMAIAAVLLVGFMLRSRKQRGRPSRHLRLAAFADDNGLRYEPGPVRSGLLARLADRGDIAVRGLTRSVGRPEVEVGDLVIVAGDSGRRSTRFGGYCAMRLPRRLPNLLLLAEGAHRHPLTDAAPPAAGQRLSLEGDFDRTFALHCPQGYERDALYLMTPDVMARLVDRAGGWDVEIVDDVLVLSRARDVIGLDPAAWRELAATVQALREKVDRWTRWRDERADSMPAIEGARLVHDAAVAPAGRRLRPGVLRVLLITVGLPVAGIVLVVLTRLLDR